MTAAERKKFRASKEWHTLREEKHNEQSGTDPITGSRLPKRAHLHHKDLNSDNYDNIGNHNKFILLQPTTHKAIHWGLTQIKKTHSMEIIERFVEELLEESILNGYIKGDGNE